MAARLAHDYGPGRCFLDVEVWPRWPAFNMEDANLERVRAGSDYRLGKPVKADDLPVALEHVKDDRGNNFVVRWAKKVLFDDGQVKKTCWFKAGHSGSKLTELEAFRLAWQYFRELVDRAPTSRGAHGTGLMGEIEGDGKRYHGSSGHHVFTASGLFSQLSRPWIVAEAAASVVIQGMRWVTAELRMRRSSLAVAKCLHEGR